MHRVWILKKGKQKDLKIRRMNDVGHVSRLTSLATCFSDLRPTYHTKRRLIALYGPSHQQAVQEAVTVCLSTIRPLSESKTGGGGDS